MPRSAASDPDPRSSGGWRSYILLLTSLPVEMFSASDLLALYRFRWQIRTRDQTDGEVSLRLLAGLPAKKPELAKAGVYADLIVAILAEQIAGEIPDSPPCGPREANRQPIAVASRENGARQHYRGHSRTVAVAEHSQRICANSSPPL